MYNNFSVSYRRSISTPHGSRLQELETATNRFVEFEGRPMLHLFRFGSCSSELRGTWDLLKQL